METLRERIKRHEGLRLTPYRDSEGFWTVGRGHNMDNPISGAAADMIFEDDLSAAVNDFKKLSPWMPPFLKQARVEVLVEMIFQLGIGGVLKFKRMLAALRQENYDSAADEMLDSLAARQTPERWKELSGIMRTGDSDPLN